MAVTKDRSVPSLWSTGAFDDFRKEMDGLVSSFFGGRAGTPFAGPAGRTLPEGVLRPAIDVTEGADAITVRAELPGLGEEDVDLTLREGVLTLSGEKRYAHDDASEDAHVIERAYGAFSRRIPVPERVDAGAITAKFDKGVLVVTMPKRADAKAEARKVPIG